MRKANRSHSRKASLRREERSSTIADAAGDAAALQVQTPQTATPQMATSQTAPWRAQTPQYDLIKLAADVHGAFYMMARQIDNTAPQPPQKLTPRQFLEFAGKQVRLARRVVCCYEAGCFGYGLHRQLTAMGIETLVIAPQNWDERNTKVRTDKTDTTAMLSRLDRYLAGNRKALAVVRVPTVAEELSRGRVRQRQQFMADRNRWANQGKSMLLYHGIKVPWSWWEPARHAAIEKQVQQERPDAAEQILTLLREYEQMVLTLDEKLMELTRQLRHAQQNRPKAKRLRGIGELSCERIEREVCDWNRFVNRRQVGSYTGLCPSVEGTGGKFVSGSVSKHGNRRLRAALAEVVWLLPRYQPNWPPLKRWRAVLEGTNRSARKRAAVALARRLAVDLWRLETGRATAHELGLVLLEDPAPQGAATTTTTPTATRTRTTAPTATETTTPTATETTTWNGSGRVNVRRKDGRRCSPLPEQRSPAPPGGRRASPPRKTPQAHPASIF